MGALFGKLGKTGINDQFRSQVQDMLKPGNSAIVIMADKITEDKFIDAMKPYGGQVLQDLAVRRGREGTSPRAWRQLNHPRQAPENRQRSRVRPQQDGSAGSQAAGAHHGDPGARHLPRAALPRNWTIASASRPMPWVRP